MKMFNLFILLTLVVGCAATSSRLTYHVEGKYNNVEELKKEIDRFAESEAAKDPELRFLAIRDFILADKKKPINVRVEAVRYLVQEKGFDPNIAWTGRKSINHTPLFLLTKGCPDYTSLPKGHALKFARVLLDAGADPNFVVDPKATRSTYVHFAAGVTPYYEMKKNRYYTSCKGNVEVYGELLSRGGNPNLKNKFGYSAKEIFDSIQIRREHELYMKNKSNDNLFGKALAIAAGAGLAAGSSMNSNQKANFFQSYTADVMNNTGGSNMRKWQRNELLDKVVVAKSLQDNLVKNTASKSAIKLANKSVPSVNCYAYDSTNSYIQGKEMPKRSVGFQGYQYEVVKFRPFYCYTDFINQDTKTFIRNVAIIKQFNRSSCNRQIDYSSISEAERNPRYVKNSLGYCYDSIQERDSFIAKAKEKRNSKKQGSQQ